MNYTVIEYTPGYLPEDDDPPVFDQYAQALNYLMEERKRIEDDGWDYGDGDYQALEFSDGMQDGWFSYTNTKLSHDLGRVVVIVPVEEE